MTPILKRLSDIFAGSQVMTDGLREVEKLEEAIVAMGKKTGLTKAFELV